MFCFNDVYWYILYMLRFVRCAGTWRGLTVAVKTVSCTATNRQMTVSIIHGCQTLALLAPLIFAACVYCASSL